MPRQRGERFPTAGHVVEYLHDYEQRYELPVHRPVQVSDVRAHSRGLSVETDRGTWHAAFVISATGTWETPFMPAYPGMAEFAGEQLVVVGVGNPAGEIVGEGSTIAGTTWATGHARRVMPDDVDGRVLFDTATREEAARKAGTHADGVSGLGDIVMVPSVRAARDRGVLRPRPLFDRLTAEGAAWSDGTMDPYDAIIWCTGFRPTLGHLAPLSLRRVNGVPKTIGTRSADEP